VIRGLGTDVVEIGRIARLLDGPPGRSTRFLARVYTSAEQAACLGRVDRAAALAARFAAKEAALKALGVPKGVRFTELEVQRGEGQPPRLALAGTAARAATALGVTRAFLTLSHDGGVAVATVILEGP
jgi:holo-[acyl-carrier protein] synthase